jgi:serine/threonine protein kinase
MTQPEADAWRFDEGEEIASGRHALKLLGGGRRYEAYLVWDDHLFTTTVAKLLRPSAVDDPRARDELVREARALRALQHPVLPRCFDAVLDGRRPHLLLEFLEGPRLSTLLRRYGPIAIEQTLPLALQLCSALQYMHAERMLHLDVKPKNIIMSAPPRLIDLSIARSPEAARETIGPLGTDAYMAPEQCGVPGSGQMGPATDVWGLGVTLFESIAGRLPFRRGDRTADGPARFPQLAEEPGRLPKDVPAEVADPVLACLRRPPEDRPAIADLAGVLQTLADALPRRPLLGMLRPRPRGRRS